MGGGEPRQHTENRIMNEKRETPESASAPPTGSASRERSESLTHQPAPCGDPPPIPPTEAAEAKEPTWRTKGVAEDGSVESYVVKTYYAPLKSVCRDDGDDFVRLLVDNGPTDLEIRIPVGMWINIAQQLSEQPESE